MLVACSSCRQVHRHETAPCTEHQPGRLKSTVFARLPTGTGRAPFEASGTFSGIKRSYLFAGRCGRCPARTEDFRCRATVLKLGKRLIYGVAACLGTRGVLTHHTLTYVRP